MKKKSAILGYTIIELLIAVTIIALLSLMALPNFYKTRIGTRKSVCISNLRQLDAAVDRWVFENDINEGYEVTLEDEKQIYSYLRSGLPECPAGGTYTITTIGSYPQVTCNIEGHTLVVQ